MGEINKEISKEISIKCVELLKEIHSLDWTLDKSYPMRNKPVKYVSVAKMKRQITPILDKHNQILTIGQDEFFQPIIQENRIITKYVGRLIIDGCVVIEESIISEGQVEGKQCVVAQTNAYRTFCLSNFGIIDGMEDDQPKLREKDKDLIPIEQDNACVDVNQTREQINVQDVPHAEPLPSQISNIMQRAQRSAYQTIMTSSNVPQDVRIEQEIMYNSIHTNEDVKEFLKYKQDKGII